jgi:small subunit ribosomal protein S14
MAKKSKIQRELKLVRIANNHEQQIIVIREQRAKNSKQFQALKERAASGQNVEQELQHLKREATMLTFKEQKIPRAARMSRQRRRCASSGRPRGVVLGLSRNEMRQRAWAGEVPGVLKCSW